MVGMKRSRNREVGKREIFMVGVRRSRNARLEAQFRGAACKANKQDLGIMPLGWNPGKNKGEGEGSWLLLSHGVESYHISIEVRD